VLILLPPSEAKTAPAVGRAIALDQLRHQELTDARRRVGDALARVSSQRNAMDVLGAGASLGDEVRRNTALWSNPAAPASSVYSGVLYDAAQAAAWTPRADDRVRIMSALWGVVAPSDAIPAYRLSAGTTLGRLGNVTAFWRPRLVPVLAELSADRLVIDCRSSGYAAMWAAPRDRAIAVRVERDSGGKRAVVSHLAKHWRGLLTRALLSQPHDSDTPQAVAAVASGIEGVAGVELRPGALTLVVATA
jgi:cytoplasmic iron level regulating protein YaaA (DUF328/UPF0246 family)